MNEVTKIAKWPRGRRGRPVEAQYGRWSLLERIGTRNGSPLWRCRCACGIVRDVVQRHLVGGYSQSCGCLSVDVSSKLHKTHGETNPTTPEYRSWAAMIQRCHGSPDPKDLINYKNRGIVVCQRWRDSYEDFLADMGRKPSHHHSLDREDNDGNYEPANCRWATPKEQANNKRRSISLKTKLAAALLELGHVPYEHAKLMTQDQLVSLYQFDHNILHATEPNNNNFWNLTPRLIQPHREKSKLDTSKVAKTKRIDKKWTEFCSQVLAKPRSIEKKHKWPKRKFRS